MSANDTKPDYYEILGISKNATLDEIKERYRTLALKFHPDKEKSNLAGEMMVLINEAYEILSNPEKRQAYDNNCSYNYTQEQNQTSNENDEKSRINQKPIAKFFHLWASTPSQF